VEHEDTEWPEPKNIGMWRNKRAHRRCAFCKNWALKIYPLVMGNGSGCVDTCMVKDKTINPYRPRPLCRLFALADRAYRPKRIDMRPPVPKCQEE